ncbi:MAG: hypothetical protein LUB61_07955, partial [Eggerthellaceae bacterium]|nr:hypothetical protein [Eggerthellaceae bacterium]
DKSDEPTQEQVDREIDREDIMDSGPDAPAPEGTKEELDHLEKKIGPASEESSLKDDGKKSDKK